MMHDQENRSDDVIYWCWNPAQKQMKEERHISAPCHKDYSEQH